MRFQLCRANPLRRQGNSATLAQVHSVGRPQYRSGLGQAYVARAFPPESKQRVQQMVNNLKVALGQEIDSMDWMSPQTKKQAHVKLAAQIDKIGYPDHWRDYSGLEIRRTIIWPTCSVRRHSNSIASFRKLASGWTGPSGA